MGRAFEVRKAAMAKTGAAKSKVYTKFSKEIYMIAKNGADPESNLPLKHMIDKAKKNQVPADVIKRAIEKASGGSGEDYQSVRYEGFGPNGSSIIVDCLTDNVNRTVSDVKNCFTKSKNKMGVAGSVSHLYKSLGMIQIKGENLDEDSILMPLIEADVEPEDIEEDSSGENQKVVYVVDKDLQKARLALEAANIEILDQEIAMVSQLEVTLTDEDDIASFQKLLDMLEEVDDVQDVYHNVENL